MKGVHTGRLVVAGLMLVAALRAKSEKIDFDVLRERARQLAMTSYAPPPTVPESLRQLNYDQYRLIEFNARHTLWRQQALPFQAQFFHPGNLFGRVVRISELRGQHAQPIEFRREWFNYRSLALGELPEELGFAGFRLLYPLNRPEDELGAFLGASYFRFLCKGAAYGLSARGLALNTAEPAGEEFPMFREFWLERPERRAASMNVYALLDSGSVSGAYRFTITPGAVTVMQVKAVLFARKNVAVFGVAPLTSMFWRGEHSTAPGGDFRPEVHDSDGLLVHTSQGEWLWRPLANPREVRVTRFGDENPRAFGLLQRDRNFENYQDIEAAYHVRPSAWVEPVGPWGRGEVRLVELPTKNEFADNIVAFWQPEKIPAPGEPLEIEYRIRWCLDQIRPPGGYALATRHGDSLQDPSLEQFIVDFDGPALRKLAADAKVEHVLSVGDGAKTIFSGVQKNPFNGSWRVAFTLQPDRSGRPVELRCFLRRPPHALTETWSYLWQP